MTVAERRLQLELRAPGHAPVSYEAEEIIIPGAAGVFTVLPGHTPLLSALGYGVIVAYDSSGESKFFAVHDGFAEILNDHILILADTMELAENIDEERAHAALERATEQLLKASTKSEIGLAEAALGRSMARIQARSGEEF